MGKIMARAILFWLEEVRRRALSDASFAFKLESIWDLSLKFDFRPKISYADYTLEDSVIIKYRQF